MAKAKTVQKPVSKRASSDTKKPVPVAVDSAPAIINPVPAVNLPDPVVTNPIPSLDTHFIPAASCSGTCGITVKFNVDEAIEKLQAMGFLVQMEEETKTHEAPTIVIPYKKEAAAGFELLYALRAWDKNLPGCKVVVIGDREDWFSDEIVHIGTLALSNNPQIDVAYKLMVAIEAPEVPAKFIWSNDDIYPVTPLHLADLELLTTSGKLGETKPNVNGMYLENLQRTLSALKEKASSFWDYSTHTPFVFEKDKLADILEQYQPYQEGYLISSLYFNTYFPDVVPIKIPGGKADPYVGFVYKENPDLEILKHAIENRKFINHNNKGYKQVIKLIEQKFKDKSRFEL